MLKTILDFAVPGLVFFAMLVVGLGLTGEHFYRVARQPKLVLAATIGQCLCLPLLGLILVQSVDLSSSVKAGVQLVATCPAGAMANLYAHWSRANVALSVTLTTVSCLLATLTMPMLLALLQRFTNEQADFAVPISLLVRQLVVTLIVPVIVGMGIRRRWPQFPERHQRGLFVLSLMALAVLLSLVIVSEFRRFVEGWSDILLAVTILTSVWFATGWFTGLLSGANATDRFTVALVFIVRNVGIATFIAVTALGKVEFAVFATAYFVSQVPLVLAAISIFQWMRARTDGLSNVEA